MAKCRLLADVGIIHVVHASAGANRLRVHAGVCMYHEKPEKPRCPGPPCRYKGEAAKLRNSSGLRHVDPHQVSISPDGTEVVISLCRSATLDASYLVRWVAVLCVHPLVNWCSCQ